MSEQIVVTGAGGFVGGAITRALAGAGAQVVALGRRDYPHLNHPNIRQAKIDLASPQADLGALFEKSLAVFHVAAHVQMWGPYQDFFNNNVVATRNVLNACQKFKVPHLIFTSSPSVVANGTNLRGIDESFPYPEKHHAYYPETKAIAEKEVLAANNLDGLKTIALRPHLIFGPGDSSFIPRVLESARAGRLKIIGSGENLVDFSYIDDCVQAHLKALKALQDGAAKGGEAYFISQGEPTKLWWWINQVLKKHGLPEINQRIPVWLASTIATVSEIAARSGLIKHAPKITKFLVEEMHTDHYFSIEKAKRELGYCPTVSVAEGLELTFAN